VVKPIEITDSTFQAEVIEADRAVLVDFWAPWCAPCRVVGPILAELAEQRQDQLKVVKVNIDEYQEQAAKQRVMILPTLVLFKGGQAVDRLQGALPKRAIVALLDQHLGEPAEPVAQA
jgi:thioredoxin 1